MSFRYRKKLCPVCIQHLCTTVCALETPADPCNTTKIVDAWMHIKKLRICNILKPRLKYFS